MWLWIRGIFAAVSVGAILVVGCGGNVVVDGTGGPGGGGGQGGAPGTTPTVPFPATGAATGGGTFPTSTSSGGTTWTPTPPETTTPSGTTTPTSTGPSACDGTGDCGDGETGCLGCAVNGACEELYWSCLESNSCIDYAECISFCDPGDSACQQECQEDEPVGAQMYVDLILCAVCWQCASDCESAIFGCP